MLPQQAGEPSARSAQVWKSPLLMEVNLVGSGVAVGTGVGVGALVGVGVGVGMGALVGIGVGVSVDVGAGVGSGVGIATIVAFTPAAMVAWVSGVLVGSCS